MTRKTKKQRVAELMAPPPPLDFTLAELARRASYVPETKARRRNAIRDAHQALIEVLQLLESYSKYPALVSRGTVDQVHKEIRRRLKLLAPPPAKTLTDLNLLLGVGADEEADAAA